MDRHHKILNISGTKVIFPFEPYDIQRRYMECVINAVKERKNALLESPTGTGKTLSLLCSSVAWHQTSAPSKTKIYYTSRTHIQLNQAAKEMKRTAYAKVPSVVMASRIHMCLNDEVKNQSEDQSINRACHNATKRNACSYYKNYEQKLTTNLDQNNVHDIEDLYNFGRAHECCPYYASKKIAESQASIIFMPYNYLLDLSIHKSVQFRVDDSVVIFDEGHNIESALKDSASAHFTQDYITIVQESCITLPSKMSKALTSELHGLSRLGLNPDKKKNAKDSDKTNPIEELAAKLTNDKLQQVNKCAMSLSTCKDMLRFKDGEYESTKISIKSVYGKLRESGIIFSSADSIIETLDNMATFWSIAGVMRPQEIARYLNAITNLSKFISLMFPPGFMTKEKFEKHVCNLEDFFSVYLEGEFEESPIMMSKKLIGWVMNLWCLHPKLGLDRIIENTSVHGPRSLIITSGTLAPMHQMKDELGREFKYIEEFDHLIDSRQFKISILGQSPKGYSLMSTYTEARRPEYLRAIGQTLHSLLQILPFGTLVFFPSYAMMNRVTGYLERHCGPLWNQICQATKIFIEPQSQSKFRDEMINFKRIIDKGGRAVFMGVCRGKLSEGTNLEANHCRSVIITGLPFPCRTDPKILETLEFHRRKGDDRGVWYQLQMKRAVGQAIGRVIRSKDDFGMLFLCDPRFPQYGLSLSKWIQQFYPKYPSDDYKRLAHEIKEFFAVHNIDISATSMADMSESNQNSVFEIERPPVRHNLLNDSVIGVASKSVQKKNLKRDEINLMNVENDLPNKSVNHVAQMLKGYTVDKETYERVKGSRKTSPPDLDSISDHKKQKTSSETVFDSIFSEGPNRTDSDATLYEQESISIKMNRTHIKLKQESFGSSSVNHVNTIKEDTEIKTGIEGASSSHVRPETKCYICKNTAIKPHVINCPCARLGCYSCLKGLNNKDCGDCNTKLKVKKFKQKLFNVFQKREV